MKVLPFHIPKTEQASLHTQEDLMPFFYDIFHRHPEYQVTYIVKSKGTLLLTDEMEDFEPGDLFIIGPNQPHVFKNDSTYYDEQVDDSAHAISLFFDFNTFGSHFLELPENTQLFRLLKQSLGARRYAKEETEKIRPLIFTVLKRSPSFKLLGLLELLYQLSILKTSRVLGAQGGEEIKATTTDYRINQVIEFTIKEYHRQISLAEVASLANMTVTSFCRYFKKRTRKSFVDFLTEVRVRQACKLLQRAEQSVNEIAYQVGFNNLSNFNRSFKRITTINPTTYRARFITKE